MSFHKADDQVGAQVDWIAGIKCLTDRYAHPDPEEKQASSLRKHATLRGAMNRVLLLFYKQSSLGQSSENDNKLSFSLLFFFLAIVLDLVSHPIWSGLIAFQDQSVQSAASNRIGYSPHSSLHRTGGFVVPILRFRRLRVFHFLSFFHGIFTYQQHLLY